jgi:hypothetical protein
MYRPVKMETTKAVGSPRKTLAFHEQREAFVGTLTNVATGFVVCLTFVLIVALFREPAVAQGGIVWGMSLLIVFGPTFSLGIGKSVQCPKWENISQLH